MTPYAGQIKHVELLERDKAQTTLLKVYRNNSQVIPSSATYSLKKPNGDYILEDATANIDVEGTISYNHTTTQISSDLNLGEGYLQEWKVTIESIEHIFRRTSAIVLRRLYPVVSDIDLTATYSDLQDLRPSNLSSYQTYIDEAWYMIQNKIRNNGNGFGYLVMSPEAFRQAHINLSLYLIFRDFHSSLAQTGGRYLELAQEHYKMHTHDMETMTWQYDENHLNRTEDGKTRTRGQSTIFLSRSGHYFRYGRRR
jgi:hypothetical protein